MVHLKNNLNEKGESWVMIIPTVHQTCAHSWEMFQMNGGKCIAKWSENPLESWNKSVRAFQSSVAARARQNSMRNNINDILTRMLIMSNPEITTKKSSTLMHNLW